MTQRMTRKTHPRTDPKVDYVLLTGEVYCGLTGMDSNDSGDVKDIVVLASTQKTTRRKIGPELSLDTWLDKRGITPLTLDKGRIARAEDFHEVNLRIFNASDLDKLRKLPRSAFIDDKDEINSLDATKKLAKLFDVPLAEFRHLKGPESGIDF